MKKALAVLLSLLMLASIASMTVGAGEHIPGRLGSENYTTAPTATAYQVTTAPKIDGKIDPNEYGPKQFTMTKDYLINGKGLIWVNIDRVTQIENQPLNVTADVYMAWDSGHFYFAMEVTKPADHYNNEMTNDLLWKGDCLQIQIAESTSADRYELGFAYSTGRKSQLSYQWFPVPKETGLQRGKDYTVVLNSSNKKKAVYEIALPVSYFSKKTDLFKQGAKIPFSFALHVDDRNDPVAKLDPNVTPGCFYEWAQGVVGGNLEKQITSAAIITLGGPASGGDTTPKSTTSPKPSTTTRPVGGSTTKPTNTGVTGSNTTEASTTVSTTTTETTTITASAGSEVLVVADLPVSSDEAILNQAKAKFEDKEIEVREAERPEGKNYDVHKDQLLDMYYMKDGNLTEVPYDESEDGVRTYKVSELPEDVKTLYVVAEVPQEEPSEEEPTDTTTAATTTASATQAVVTTTGGGESGGGSLTWLIVLIVAVVVIGGGVGAYFFIRKRQQQAE